jgi:hypothetical protein
MLPVEERRTSGGRYDGNDRRTGERRKDPVNSREIGPFGGRTEYIGHDAGTGYEGISRVREAGAFDRSGGHKPVTFWTLDGSCHAGTTPHIGGVVIFVESRIAVPVGTEVTVSLAPVEKQSDAQDLAEGTVVWSCPLGDEFENQGGFGVLLRRQWPKWPDSGSALGQTEAT